MLEKLNGTYREMDTVDIIAVIAVFLGTSVLSGMAVISFFGYDMATVATTLGTSIDLQYALIAPIGGYFLAFATNGFKARDVEAYSNLEKGALAFGLSMLVVFVLSPDVAALVTDYTVGQMVYVGASLASVVTLAAK